MMIFTLSLCAAFLSSCQRGDPVVESRLREAARIVSEYPDSSLGILESIAMSEMNEEQQARLCLEMAEALWIIEGHIYEDSLINIAYDYYLGRGDSLDIKSQFLKGVSIYDSGNNGEALVSLTETYERAIETGNLYYAAMCARTLGWVYHSLMIVDKNYEWTKRSYDMFVELDKPLNAAWRQMDLADVLVYKRQYEEAESLLNSIDTAIISSDRQLEIEIAKSRLMIMTDCERYDETINQINLLSNLGSMPTIAWSELSLISALKGDVVLAWEARDSVLSTTTYYQDSLFCDYLSALILGTKGDYENGYKQAIIWGENVAKYTEKAIVEPQILILNDYFEARAKIKSLKLTQSYWIIVMGVIVLFLMIILCLYLNLLKEKYRLSNELEKEKVDKSNEEILDLKKNIDTLRLSQGTLQKDIVSLLIVC